MTTRPSIETRLARVERAIEALSREVAAIRSELGANGSAAAASSAPSSAPSSAASGAIPANLGTRFGRLGASRPLDFERLIGAYGMLGIGAIAAVAAVGTFLNWAIVHGYLALTPSARVVLGLAFAAAIGVWGARLRRRERSFGSSLLGLSLVIVLVCAYAAGPRFHLVSTATAFIGGAMVAWGLAIVARAEDDEPLWCLAFGGATVAPFVASDGHGRLYALVAYALCLMFAASFAMGGRSWRVAWRVFYASSAVLVLAAANLANTHGETGCITVFWLPIAIAVAAVLPFAPASRKRGALRWLVALAVVVAVGANGSFRLPWSSAAPAILVAVPMWLIIVDRLPGVPQSTMLPMTRMPRGELDWIDVAAIPLALVFIAVEPVSSAYTDSLIFGVSALTFGVFLARRPVSASRDAAAFACAAVALAAITALSLETPLVRIAAFLAIAIGALAAHRAWPSRSWLVMGGAIGAVAAGWTVESLLNRPRYASVPFGTEPSAAALCVLAASIIVARLWRWLFDATRASMTPRSTRSYAGLLRVLLDGVVVAPWVWAFVWVLLELSMAYSQSTSTLLLVTYFAATAVGSVAAGRARRSARIRQAGLCLALAAAATAVYGATTFFDSGTRVAAYLVTSMFLLGIAYWYRRPGARPIAERIRDP
ncbi:MAG TPA: DUF2339 domain-containing protein [Gemmatimonadaceae bacterium]|nr:DUF2339 domain-containing protein [Gemmatimonadaceae bacterium]